MRKLFSGMAMAVLSLLTISVYSQCPTITFDSFIVEYGQDCNPGTLDWRWSYEYTSSLENFEIGSRITGEEWAFYPTDPLFNSTGLQQSVAQGDYVFEVGIRSPSGEITICATRSFTVVSGDADPPSMGCSEGITFPLSTSEPITFDVNHPSIQDNCGDYTATVEYTFPNGAGGGGTLQPDSEPISVTFDLVGTYEFTWTAVDASGNVSECTATYVVTPPEEECVDTEEPTIDCVPGPINVDISSGPVVQSFPIPAMSDDCGVTNSFGFVRDPSGSWNQITDFSDPIMITFSMPGEYEISWRAQDEAGNDTDCRTKIMVVEGCTDAEAPTIDCDPGPITVDVSGGPVTQSFPVPLMTDDCGITNSFAFYMGPDGQWIDLGSTSPGGSVSITFEAAGDYEISWRALDEAGNDTDCRTQITATSETPEDIQVWVVPPSTCDATDGVVVFEHAVSLCETADNLYERIEYITSNSSSEWRPLSTSPGVSVDETSITWTGVGVAGKVKVHIGVDDGTGTIVDCIPPQTVDITPARDDYAGPTIDCPAMIMDTLDESGMATVTVPHPNFMAGCGRVITSTQGFLNRAGEIIYNDLGSVPNPIVFTFDKVGTYEVFWSASDSDNNRTGCATTIVIKPNESGVGTSDLCADASAFVSAEDCNVGVSSIPIEIAGVGNIGQSNGLVEVYIEANVPGNFTGSIWLDAPSGERIALALSTEGSYPTYNGSISGGSMRWYVLDCPNVEPHNSTAASNWSDILGFQPYQSFEVLNNTGLDADGTWNLVICNNEISQAFDVTCAQLKFAPVCPQIDELTTTPASCMGADGSITVTSATTGYCTKNVFYSIDGTSWQTDPVFPDLSAGEYSIYITNDPAGDCISFENIAVSSDGDTEPPQLINCPADQTVEAGENNRASVVITEPTSTDDCAVVLDTLIICSPTGALTGYQASPGSTKTWTIPPGKWTYKWIAVDATGKSDTCLITITVEKPCDYDIEPPVISQCPSDTVLILPITDTVTLFLTDPTASDNCGIAADTVVFVGLDTVKGYNLEPGETSRWTFTGVGKRTIHWIFTDKAGNADTCSMMITIVEEPDSCTFDRTPPIIVDCPPNQTFDITDGELVSWSLIEPSYFDDCGIRSATLQVTGIDGQTIRSTAQPGNMLTGQSDQPGKYTYTWTITDQAGNRATCQTMVSLVCPAVCEPNLWFMANNCGPGKDALEAGACQTAQEAKLSISVDGVGELSKALGLLEVEITGQQPEAFAGQYWLRDPANNWYELANVDKGSFQAFDANQNFGHFKMRFRPSKSAPESLAFASNNPPFGSFDPDGTPVGGTIFTDPNIITGEDPSALVSVSYAGQATREIFDRRINDFINVNAFVFDVLFNDGLTCEVVVNPEFNSVEAARIVAEKYAWYVGQLPYVLRTDVDEIEISQGDQPWGGGNRAITIHTGKGEEYQMIGILEETLIHEACHTSLDGYHANADRWISAQQRDRQFISTYAQVFPYREDVAESFLMWLAARHFPDRISSETLGLIQNAIPYRMAYFDAQDFRLNPLTIASSSTGIALSGQVIPSLDDLSPINTEGINADGEWLVVVCNNEETDYPLEIACAKLHFGSLCPEIVSYQVQNAECNGGTGTITIEQVSTGLCNEDELVYGMEVEGVFEQNDGRVFTGLAPGDYTIVVGAPNLDSVGSIVDFICQSSMTIAVPASGDVTAPVLEDCPKGFTYSLRDGEEIEIPITSPTYYDDCSIASAIQFILLSSGTPIDTINFQPGQKVSFSNGNVGKFTFVWQVTDGAGNMSECRAVVQRTDHIDSEFCADICLSEASSLVAPLCGDCTLDIPIEVHGIGVMTRDYSLKSVSIEANFLRSYSGNIQLISPDGTMFWLASPEVGSFPTFTGDQGEIDFDVTFRRCLPGLQHDDQINPSLIPGNTFSAIDNLNGAYGLSLNADGTWYLRVCNTDPTEKFTIDCARLTFGPIRPKIKDYIVRPAGCEPDSLGSFEVVNFEEGVCSDYGYAFSIDSGRTWQQDGNFDQLLAGDYQVISAHPVNFGLTPDEVNYSWQDTVTFTVPDGGGQSPPVIFDCPRHNNYCLGVDTVWSVIEPKFGDDCSAMLEATLRIEDYGNGGMVLEERPIRPGEVLSEPITGPIQWDLIWTVTDGTDTTSCVTYLNVWDSTEVTEAVDVTEAVESIQEENVISLNFSESASNVKVIPTITRGEFEIRAQFDSSKGKMLRLFDGQGRVVLQQDLGQTDILIERLSIANQPAGLYFITIQDGHELHTTRVIKQ